LQKLIRRDERLRRSQLSSHPVEPQLVELLEQGPGLVVPGLDVLGVLGIALDAPGADRDQRRQPGEDEVAEESELLVLERNPGLVAIDRDPCGAGDLAIDLCSILRVGGEEPFRTARVAKPRSPKSAIPETRPRSSTSTLSSVKSPCTTCAER
jgi:hypothetical protein